MYSTHNEVKSVFPERFIRILKNKTLRYITSIFEVVHVDNLDDIVNEYNNTYHKTIKMRSTDVKSSTYTEFNVENKGKDPKNSMIM